MKTVKNMEPIKCNICRKTKPTNDFLKNGKTLKSCLACRDKNKTVKEPVLLPVKQSEPELTQELIPEPNPEPIPEPKPEPIPEPKPEPIPEPKPEPIPEPKPEPIPEPKPEPILETKLEPPKGWKILSGKWVKDNQNAERELHQQLTQKLIRQFKKKAALPVHQYLMKSVFVDIRDL
jgi:outer membrane biosynthesis protein TonB